MFINMVLKAFVLADIADGEKSAGSAIERWLLRDIIVITRKASREEKGVCEICLREEDKYPEIIYSSSSVRPLPACWLHSCGPSWR